MPPQTCRGLIINGKYGLDRLCTHGGNGGEAYATCALVYIKGGHVTTGLVDRCSKCAVALKARGELDGCFGYLTRGQLEEYHAAINSPHPTEFIRDGITKVSIPKSAQKILHMYTAKHFIDLNPDVLWLAHNTNQQRATDGRPTKKDTDGRMWCQLWPRDRHTMAISNRDINDLMTKATNMVRELILRAVLPIERFSQIAHELGSNAGTADVQPNQSRNSVGLLDNLLSLIGINLLWRGYHEDVIGPKNRQSIHMDGRGFRVLAIIPLQCHDGKYEFFSIPKTQRISNWKYIDSKVSDDIPSELAKPIFANTLEMIIFSERLMHAGGTCSKAEGSEVSTPTFTDAVKKKNGGGIYDGWFGNGGTISGTQPTDVAVQFCFEYNLLPDNTSLGANGKDNIWTWNENWEDGHPCKSEFQERLDKLPEDVGEADDEFVTAIKEAQAKWLHCLSTNTAYTADRALSRKRKFR